MEAKKIEETRNLVRQANTLLRQRLQKSRLALLSDGERRSLRELLRLLLPSLSIVRSYEQQHHHYRCAYATVGNAVQQVLSCAALSESDAQKEATNFSNGAMHADASLGVGQTVPSSSVKTADTFSWKDIYGCREAIFALRQATTLPMRYPALFTGPRRPWQRLLLYGPPGTGKTQLAAATAAEFKAVFLSVSAADLLSKWVGESEKQVRHAFVQAAAAGPRCVLFFDEVDALCSARGGQGESELARRLKTEFLLHLQNVAPSVLVLAATNMPWELDAAVVRRFDRFVHVELPSEEDKVRFLRDELRGVLHTIADEQLCRIAAQTDGFSLVDMRRLLSYAVMAPIEEWLSRCSAAERDAVVDAKFAFNSTDESACVLTTSSTERPVLSTPCRLSFVDATSEEVSNAEEEEVLGGTTSGSAKSAHAEVLLPSTGGISSPDNTPSSPASVRDGNSVFTHVSSHADSFETYVPPVEEKHFEEALHHVVATTSVADAARYASWSSRFA